LKKKNKADALAAADCASVLALKGQELQAFVVEASKVMSVAAESEEALAALEVMQAVASDTAQEMTRRLTSALDEAATAARAALEAELR
jgi:translation initiation factor 2B subunit (eIF-2B alpha/beta/delta family)